jgi:hypothetical protein
MCALQRATLVGRSVGGTLKVIHTTGHLRF